MTAVAPANETQRQLVEKTEEMFRKVTAAGEKLFGNDEGWKDRSCGFFVLKHIGGSVHIATLIGGKGGNYANREKYERYAYEKVERLEANLVNKHYSSWESRDESLDQWGGAIRVPMQGMWFILSFSGLPEVGDEAFMVLLAELFESFDSTLAAHCMEILRRNGNDVYDLLHGEIYKKPGR